MILYSSCGKLSFLWIRRKASGGIEHSVVRARSRTVFMRHVVCILLLILISMAPVLAINWRLTEVGDCPPGIELTLYESGDNINGCQFYICCLGTWQMGGAPQPEGAVFESYSDLTVGGYENGATVTTIAGYPRDGTILAHVEGDPAGAYNEWGDVTSFTVDVVYYDPAHIYHFEVEPKVVDDSGIIYEYQADMRQVHNNAALSAIFPTQMYVGETQMVTITATNTGTSYWSDLFWISLGAVGGSDPFTDDERAYLPQVPHGTIKPGESYDFEIDFTAPLTPGVYYSDWQMVQEQYQTFGNTVLMEINVISTPTPVPTLVGYEFETGAEGWTFSGKVQPFDAPSSGAYNSCLWLGTPNNTNCFGYWSSPAGAIPVSSDRLYLAKFFLVCPDQSRSLVPTLRMRAVSSSLQQIDWLEVSSAGLGESSPNSTGRWYDLFFDPAGNASSVSPAFDVLNFDPADAAQATVGLSAVHVYAYNTSNIGFASTEKHYTFDTGAEGWSFSGQVLPFTDLNTGVYFGALHLAKRDHNSFGYWYSPAGDITLSAVPTLYRATFWVSSDQSNASIVPELRLRVYSSNLQTAVVKDCPSTGAGDNSPIQSARKYNVYFWSSTCATSSNLQCAFDLLDFDPNDAAPATLSLDDVNVETLTLPWVP